MALADYNKTGAICRTSSAAHRRGRLPAAANRKENVPMNQMTVPPARAEIETFVGQVVTDLSAAFSGVLVNVGRKLGLYHALAEIGACTSQELADATGVRERYVREWLANQAAGGYVTYDPERQRFALT